MTHIMQIVLRHKLVLLFLCFSVTFFSCKDDDDEGRPRLSISAIAPETARVGETVTITGTGFSATASQNVVTFFSEVVATVSAASTSSLEVVVPAGASDGAISVTVNGKTATSSQSFTVNNSLGAPTLSSLTPTTGLVNTVVEIIGTNFGTEIEDVSVYFGESEVEEIVSVTNTKITVKVPTDLGGDGGEVSVKVVREGVESTSTLLFTVQKTPVDLKTVYWAASDGIYKGDITESGADISKICDANNAMGIEVEVDLGYVYWADQGTKSIRRYMLDGSGSVEVLYDATDLSSGTIWDIAIDKTNEKIYWISHTSDNKFNKIQRASFNGDGEIEDVYALDETVSDPYLYSIKLELDVDHNKIYWAEEFGDKRIMEGNLLDLEEEPKELFSADDGLGAPTGIAIDYENGKIYIVDNGALFVSDGVILYGNLSGEGDLSELAGTEDNVFKPLDAEVDLDNGYLFWMNQVDSESYEILRADLNLAEGESDFTIERLFAGISFGTYFDLDIR